MPNWCVNTFTISNLPSDTEEFFRGSYPSGEWQSHAVRQVVAVLFFDHFVGLDNDLLVRRLRDLAASNPVMDEGLIAVIDAVFQKFDRDKFKVDEAIAERFSEISFDYVARYYHCDKKTPQEWLETFLQQVFEPDGNMDCTYEFDFATFVPYRLGNGVKGYNDRLLPLLGIDFPGVQTTHLANVDHWGTKWNSGGEIEVTERSPRIAGYLQTAWSPPVPVFQAISKHYPGITVDMTFSEMGMGFCGRFVFRNGAVVESREGAMEYPDLDDPDNMSPDDCYAKCPHWVDQPLHVFTGGSNVARLEP